MFTTWPGSPLATIRGTNALMPWMTPHTLTSKPHFQSASSCSQMKPFGARADTRVVAEHVDAAVVGLDAVRELGDRLVVGDVDDDAVHGVETLGAQLGGRVLDGIGAHVGRDRRVIPSCAKRCTIASPMPLAPPVTTATLPRRSSTSVPPSQPVDTRL